MNKRSVIVSDHALVRYLERVNGVDVESLRQQIASMCADAVTAGASNYSLDGVTFCLSETGCVTTVLLGRSRTAAAMKGAKKARPRGAAMTSEWPTP